MNELVILCYNQLVIQMMLKELGLIFCYLAAIKADVYLKVNRNEVCGNYVKGKPNIGFRSFQSSDREGETSKNIFETFNERH